MWPDLNYCVCVCTCICVGCITLWLFTLSLSPLCQIMCCIMIVLRYIVCLCVSVSHCSLYKLPSLNMIRVVFFWWWLKLVNLWIFKSVITLSKLRYLNYMYICYSDNYDENRDIITIYTSHVCVVCVVCYHFDCFFFAVICTILLSDIGIFIQNLQKSARISK